MHRSKDLKNPIFRPLRGGNYQPLPQLRLLAKEGEGGEGGEGGDGGAGGAGKEGELAPGQITAINTIVHKAIGSRLASQSFKDSIGSIAGEAATKAMEGFTGKIDELIAAQKQPEDKDKDKGKPAQDWKDSPEYKAMVQRDKDRQAEHEALLAREKEKDEKEKRSEERKLLESALRKAGIEEVKIRSCAATLIHEDKVMQRDSNGDIVYRINRGEYHDDLGIAEGVADFLGTDEGKAFLPASGSGGTGAIGDSQKNGKDSQRKGARQTKEEAAKVVGAWLGGTPV